MPYLSEKRLEQLLPYCTEKQSVYLKCLSEHRSIRAAARQCGVNKNTIGRALASVERKFADSYEPNLTAQNVPLPEGFKLKRLSTFVKSDELNQWVISEPSRERLLDALRQFVQGLTEELKPVAPVQFARPEIDAFDVIPLPDLHFGMYAWEGETGLNHNIELATREILNAFSFIPAIGGDVILPILGDFFHTDTNKNKTMQHGHQLDVSGTWKLMLRKGAALTREIINILLTRYNTVEIFICPGNHDEHSSFALGEILMVLYENEPRVIVNDQSAQHQYLFKNDVLLHFTHGDMGKVNGYPLLMAVDRPKEWGKAKTRYSMHGHTHNSKITEKGCAVEGFAPTCPSDKYASGAFRGEPSLSCVTFMEGREKARSKITLYEMNDD